MDDARVARLKGALRRAQGRSLRGWAFVPADPDLHADVEVFADGALVARTTANTVLPELVRSRIGQGDHGFAIDLPADLVAAPEHMEVVAVGPGGERLRLPWPGGGAAEQPGHPTHGALATQWPVFVLGPPRAGTSAMGRALRRTERYEGHGEGHLIKLLPRLNGTVASHYSKHVQQSEPGQFTMLGAVTAERVQAALAAAFQELTRELYPTGRWMDKTPGPDMVRAAPLLRRVWPNARFVFMKRRGIENVISRCRRFASVGFEEHCRLWADTMMTWASVRDRLGSAYVEIDQAAMLADPHHAGAALADLLDLTVRETDALRQCLTDERPEMSEDAVPAGVLLADTGWQPAEQAIFSTICAEAMIRFGYWDA